MGFIGLLMAVPSIITGAFGTINGITKAISDEKIALISATTQQEQIHAQERINTLQARRDVLVAESGNKINGLMRVVLATGPAFLLLKVFIWDKALGQWTGGHTDGLDPNLWNVIMAVIGFYFLYEVSTAVTRIIKSR
jgi:hypothetical protein